MRMRVMEKADAEQLLGVYRLFAKDYVGLASRDIRSYKRLLRRRENLGWVALNEKRNIIGYVTARFDKKTREAHVREIVIDPREDFEKIAKRLVDRAYKSLLEKKPAVISAGSICNPVYEKIFPELGFFAVKSTDAFMYTILSLPKFLVETSSVFASRLKQLKEWNGLLQLECEEYSLFIEKQQEKVETLIWINRKPDFKITLSRELLTQLLFGVADVTELFKKGKLQVETILDDEKASPILMTMFPKKQFLIMDFW